MTLAVDTGGTSPFLLELCLRLVSAVTSVTAALQQREEPLKADFSACRVTGNGTGKGRGH